MSLVTCHLSLVVTCHLSLVVTCHLSSLVTCQSLVSHLSVTCQSLVSCQLSVVTWSLVTWSLVTWSLVTYCLVSCLTCCLFIVICGFLCGVFFSCLSTTNKQLSILTYHLLSIHNLSYIFILHCLYILTCHQSYQIIDVREPSELNIASIEGRVIS